MPSKATKLAPLRELAHDLARTLREPQRRAIVAAELALLPVAAREVLPWLVRARDDADESLIKQVLENARLAPRELALEMGDERLTWGELERETSRAAHALSALGLGEGQVVALVGRNSPRYLVLLLAAARLGATTAIVNHHLEGPPLAHAVRAAKAVLVVAEQRFQASLAGALGGEVRVVGYASGELDGLVAAAPPHSFPRVAVPTTRDFVYIYTSGTTGLPKPCRVTHARAVLAGAAFGNVLFQFQPGDKLYSVLPLYHSSALLIGFGSAVMTRTPLALRESFSASAFMSDVLRYRATAMLYIGELCRYLVASPPSPLERESTLRVAVGNGLRADVWPEFVRRFGVRHVREFYAATESPGAIFNLHDRVGSIGRVPFRPVARMKLARYDVERDELLRDARGFCIECRAGEVGELLIRLDEEPKSALSDFKGYTDPEATAKKIGAGIFEPGDRWYRSGDLMRFDEDDFFYFVDRIGDTYRWKGENVSTAEVADVLALAPGLREVTVTGVHVPGHEGQAGLAAVVPEGPFDAAGFWRTAQTLPAYAQPRFVRVVGRLDTTGTYKIQKTELRRAGVDPSRVADPLWLRGEEGYVPLTDALWREVVEGRVRL